MRKKYLKLILIVFLQMIIGSTLVAQSSTYQGPDDPAGDPGRIREGFMSGNRVFIRFTNTTELSKCCGVQYSKWPNDQNGLPMTDGVALLVGSRVLLDNGVPSPWATGVMDTLYYIQTHYRELVDVSKNGLIVYGFMPPKGYLNPDNEYVAMSNIKDSWPLQGWPASGNSLKWQGLWNGRFGAGVVYADLETYFVTNDAQDQEYLQDGVPVKYFPRPGVSIGDKDPDITAQFGKPWGGLGLRVETRGMQWNNPQTQDAIFFEYTIANVSDYDLSKVAFGYWVDNGIGKNEEYDDLGYYDDFLDMAFSWDIDMVSAGGIRPGILGFAYLESPGISTDGIDNDQDGLTDEKRDNVASVFYQNATEGITNLEQFKKVYGEPKPHWDADEDGDWQDGNDLNKDGKYQKTEFYGDDLGTDGVGPLDLHYEAIGGPDANGTECNHKPDYIPGIGAEPNFAITDVSESDMIGLTSFQMYGVPTSTGPAPSNDPVLWKYMDSGIKEGYSGTVENLIEMFSASPFPLYAGKTERVSMSMLHSMDYISFGEREPKVPLLARKKEVVQVIYERDYRFATPPLMPTLTATAADGKVILSWNDVADKFTKEPLLNNVNDFEGYKLYKATDKYFSDPEVITNGFGEPTLKKPIYQCDLVNEKKGFTDFGLVDGMAYYLGNDTGIEHYYIDTDVKNGVTYYYALVAYDYGIPDVGEGITPYENSTILDLNEYGEIRNSGINVAIVKPTKMAAGYVPPSVELETKYENNNINSNPFNIKVVDHLQAQPGKKYKVKFTSTDVDSLQNFTRRSDYDVKFITSGVEVYDVTGSEEKLLFIENSEDGNNLRNNLVDKNEDNWRKSVEHYPVGKEVSTNLIDGMQIDFTPTVNRPIIDEDKSGWVVGDSPIKVYTSPWESTFFPWDYEIVFTDYSKVYSTVNNYTRYIISAEGKSLKTTQIINGLDWNFYVVNKSFTDKNGEHPKCDLLVNDLNGNGTFDLDADEVMVGHPVYDSYKVRWGGTIFGISFKDAVNDMPSANDVYRLSFKAPLSERDSLVFTVKESIKVDKEKLDTDLNEIRVVPNPYVATNSMEPAVSLPGMNQQRRIMFTNLPASCTIKIFTMSGVLVDEMVVENPAERGSAQWDLLSREGLEIAAGVYIYQVKANETGKEKIGKFAVIK
ncbi:MAG: hypothetical protein ACEPO8_06845 [Rhodothermaceae bacterium]